MKPKKIECKEFKIVSNGNCSSSMLYVDNKQLGLVKKIFFHADTGHDNVIIKGIQSKITNGHVTERPFEIVFKK